MKTMESWMICCTKEGFSENASIFKMLSNPIRLEILNRLRVKDHTVEQLTKLLDLRKANTSQHLSILRSAKIILPRRNGQNVYYHLAQPKIVEACRVLKEIREEQITS